MSQHVDRHASVGAWSAWAMCLDPIKAAIERVAYRTPILRHFGQAIVMLFTCCRPPSLGDHYA
jgi:hypothetical protein